MEHSSRLTADSLLAQADLLRRLSRALLRDPDDQEDAVQETYVAALEQEASLRGSLGGWLRTVLRNVARRVGRNERTRRRHEERQAPVAGERTPREALQRAQLHRRLVHEVLALPEPYLTTVVLRFFEERSAAEIAVALAVPVETVRTRLKRALAMLRRKLERDFGPEDLGALLLGVPATTLPQAGAGVRAWLFAGATVVGVVGVVSLSRGLGADGSPGGREVIALQPSPPSSGTDLAIADETPVSPAFVRVLAPVPPPQQEGRIRCVVLDPGGAPVAGAVVFVGPAVVAGTKAPFLGRFDNPLHDDWQLPEFTRSRTDFEGRFEIEAPDNRSAVSVAAVHATAGTGHLTEVLLDPATRSADVELSLVPGTIFKVRVTDREGRPLPGANVLVDASVGYSSVGTSGRTDDDGLLQTFPIPCESYAFQVGRTGYRAHRTPKVNAPVAPSVVERTVVLAPALEPVRGVILDLAGDPANLDTELLPGLEEWERDRQSTDTYAVLLCESDPRTWAQVPDSVRWASELRITGARDIYCPLRPIDLATGTFEATPSKPVRFAALVVREQVLGVAPVEEGREVELRVDLGAIPDRAIDGRLELDVRDAATGDPLRELSLDLGRIELGSNYQAMLHHSFDFARSAPGRVRAVPFGEYAAAIQRNGFEPVVVRTQVGREGSIDRLEVGLDRATTEFFGKVDLPGTPTPEELAAVRVRIHRARDGALIGRFGKGFENPDPTGLVHLTDLSTELHWVVVDADGFAPTAVLWNPKDELLALREEPLPLRPAPGRRVTFSVHSSSDGSLLQGRLRNAWNADGAPLHDELALLAEHGLDISRCPTVDSLLLPHEPCTVEVGAPGHRPRRVGVAADFEGVLDVLLDSDAP